MVLNYSNKKAYKFLQERITVLLHCSASCCCSVAQWCPTLYNPLDYNTPGFPVFHCLPEFAQTHVHCVDDAIQHLILSCPLLLLPSVFPSIRVFSIESALCIKWPKYQSFSFSISPSNIQGWFPSGLTGLISLLPKGLLRVLHQFFGAQPSLWSRFCM